MIRYQRIARRRQRLVRRAEASLLRETSNIDRLLVELGQHAYIERMDPWGLLAAQYAGQLAGQAEDPALSPGAAAAWRSRPQRRAETWLARIEAEQLRALAILSREEARLASELMGRAEHSRRLRWHIEHAPDGQLRAAGRASRPARRERCPLAAAGAGSQRALDERNALGALSAWQARSVADD